MSDEDDQTDELVALASIYDDSAFTSKRNAEGLTTGTLRASVEVRRPFHVKLAGDGEWISMMLSLLLTSCFIAASVELCELYWIEK